jgi:hypothetical protein
MKDVFTNPINLTLVKIAVVCLACTAAAFAQHNQDDLKQHVLAQAQSAGADDYAFTRTIRSEQSSGEKKETKVTVEKFDPSKPVDARWTLVSVDGGAPSADALKTFRAASAKRRVPGYYRLANYFETGSTVSTDSRGRAVFHFTALPKDTVKVLDTDVSQNTTADASVTEANGGPFVEQLHLTVKPMRLKLLMKLEAYESTARYRVGPEGKPQLIEQTSDMTGSGMGKEGRAHNVTTYSDYRAVGKQHVTRR